MSTRTLIFCVLAVLTEDALGKRIGNKIGSCIEGISTNKGIGHGRFGTTMPASSASPSTLLTPPINWTGPLGSKYVAPDFSIVNANKCGSFNVQSSSPIAPSGISITSENFIEGLLSLEGRLPFLSTVALEGGLPTYGAGGVAYRCDEGVAILSENYEKNAILSVEADENRKVTSVQSNGLPRLNKESISSINRRSPSAVASPFLNGDVLMLDIVS